MRILYVSRRFETNVCASIHYKAIKEICGEDNVYTVDLRPEAEYEKERYIAYGKYKNKLERIKRTFEMNPFYISNRIIRDICKLILRENINIVFIDESIFGKLVKAIKTECQGVKVITFYHDIERILYRQWFKENGISFLGDYVTAVYNEKINQKYSDCNVVLNHREAYEFEKCYRKKPDALLPMAVAPPDLNMLHAEEFNFDGKDKGICRLLFVGAYYFPNVKGLKWFHDNVFVNLGSGYRLIVAGRGMEKVRSEYENDDRVNIVGGVKNLAAFYNNADIVIAPIFEGGGMKQKTAEAFAYGRCFAGTKESLLGYEEALKIGGGLPLVFSCDKPEEYLNAFSFIRENKLYGYHEEINKLYNERYSLSASINVMKNILNI